MHLHITLASRTQALVKIIVSQHRCPALMPAWFKSRKQFTARLNDATYRVFNRVLRSNTCLLLWLQVSLFYLGDDDIMHGVLAAGVRSNMDAVFLVFLID